MMSLAWRKASALVDRIAGPRGAGYRPDLTSIHGRTTATAARLVDLCRQSLDRERSTYDPRLERPIIDLGRPVVVIDLETTDLDPGSGRITEVAAIRCDRHLRELESTHILVAPMDIDRANVRPWILENTAWGRATDQEWIDRGAITLGEACVDLGLIVEGALPMAHGLPFDMSWLSQWCGGCIDRKWFKAASRDGVCTRQLSSSLMARGLSKTDKGYRSRSLRYVADALGVPLENHHDAMCDARACLEIARILLAGEA